MPSGGLVTIATSKVHLNGDAAARRLTPGDYVVVEIIDEGEGMPPHVIERAVEPFFTTKSTGKGTGLGLAMASGFVQQSRGRMEIESSLGKGTTVRMLFPVSANQSEEARTPAATRQRSPDADGLGGEHILVVEDSPEVLELALENLEGAGYRVTTAPSGDAGIEAFRAAIVNDRIDLVFTDLVMPGSMNGIVLANDVRKLDPDVAVLMTIGYNEQVVLDGPRPAGQDVLGKPYRKAELLDRIRQALNNHEPCARRRPSDFGHAEE